MEKQEKICRLCLENCANCFKLIEENVTKILGTFLKCTSTIGQDVMCKNCTESYKECFNFKSTCLDVEDCIVQFAKGKDSNAKLDPKDIYLSKEAKYVPEGHNICRLCMSSFEICSLVPIDSREGIMLEEMIEKCLPELDLRATEKPAICVVCDKSLQHYLDFITNCLSVEEKIRKYREIASVNGRDPIKLKDVLEFTTGNIFDKVDGIKIEAKFHGDEEHPDEQKYNNELLCISENVPTIKQEIERVDRIKIEGIFLQEMENKFGPKPKYLMKMEEQQFNSVHKCEDIDDQVDGIEVKLLYYQEGVNELKLKQENLNSIQDCDIFSQTETNLPKAQKCSMVQPHRPLPQVEVSALRRTVHQSDSCSYQTKYKRGLAKHKLIHEKPSDMCLCGSGLIQTNHECTLNRQLLTEVITCKFCSYQTKCENNLTKHLLTHKDPLEITMYQCKHCLFQTRYKHYLKTHMEIHKDTPKSKFNQCEFCSYQTKFKSKLRRHLVTHKNPSEITMYHCELCSFQTKYKHDLKRHLLTHENPSETTMYQCEHCLFQTKHKGYIKRHLLSHKNPSEVTMYQCEHCSFQTKYKYPLKRHLLLHKNPSEISMYQCEHCFFQTKHKHHLKRHLLTHKIPITSLILDKI